jgi:uncharacterized protein with von Willebrand factor type A (vWA) domain
MLSEALVSFCQFLRGRGLTPGLQQTLDSLEAAKAVNLSDRESLKYALKAILCSSKEDWDRFDGLFEEFWTGKLSAASSPANEPRKRQEKAKVKDARADLSELLARSNAEESSQLVAGASKLDRLARADFSTISHSDMAQLDRLSLRLLSLMSQRVSRSFRAPKTHGGLDLRATIRRSVPMGGIPMHLRFKGMKPRPPRLVILLDVSGSMNPYSLFLVRFAYALQKHFHRVSTFLFSTHIKEITRTLKARQLRDALEQLSREEAGWAGGTRIGESLRVFSRSHSRRLLTRRTVFIVLSDGWDTGTPEELAGQLAAIQRRTRKLIWLNPLLGMEDYQPLTRALSAALPFIDVFAPAHNLESLLQLEKYLRV